MHLAQEKLLTLAFGVLADIAANAPAEPLRPGLSTRLALAVAYAFSEGDRWPFDDFWRQMRKDWIQQPSAELRAHCRRKYLSQALEGIRLAVRGANPDFGAGARERRKEGTDRSGPRGTPPAA